MSVSQVLARNTLFNFGGQAFVAGVAVVSLPIIVRGLGVSGFGLFSIGLAVLGSISFLELGLGRASNKFVASAVSRGEGSMASRAIWASLRIQTLIGVGAGAALAAFAPPLATQVLRVNPDSVSDALTMLYALAFGIPIMLTMSTLRGALEGLQRFDLVNLVRVGVNAATYGTPLLGAFLGLRVPEIILILVVVRIAAVLTYFGILARSLPGFVSSRREGAPSGLYSFAGWVAVSNMVVPLLSQADRFFIASRVSVEAVTYYSVPFELLMGLWIIPGGISAALFPVFSRADVTPHRLRQLYVRPQKYIIATLCPLCLLISVFSWELLALWQGPGIADRSHLVLSTLAAAVLINSLGWVPVNFLTGIGAAGWVARLHVLQLALYLPFCLAMTQAFGVAGTAVAFLTRVGFETAILSVMSLRRLVPAAGRESGFFVAVLSAVTLAVSLFLIKLSPWSNLWRITLVGAVTVCYSVFIWFGSLDDTDRNLLRSLLSPRELEGQEDLDGAA